MSNLLAPHEGDDISDLRRDRPELHHFEIAAHSALLPWIGYLLPFLVLASPIFLVPLALISILSAYAGTSIPAEVFPSVVASLVTVYREFLQSHVLTITDAIFSWIGAAYTANAGRIADTVSATISGVISGLIVASLTRRR